MSKDSKFLISEANRCLLCKNARCQTKCPINTEIPEVIRLYRDGEVDKAGEILFKNNPLSVVCSVICPHENQCKGNCIKGIKGEPIDFYEIEEFISNEYLKNLSLKPEEELKDRIAIVGSGPAGITIAFILAQRGYKVTLFEKNEKIGGVLRYGIPEFRLPKDILDRIQDLLIQLGVKIRPNTLIGPVLTIDKLFDDGYKAIFIGTGVWNPKKLNIKGESLGNAHYAIDYLKSPTVYNLGKKVIVIGAGNTAMDSARTAKRNGADEVSIIYRKGSEDMTATNHEIEEAKEEGVKFELYKVPVEIVDEGVIFRETEKITDVDGNTRVIEKEGTEALIECDSVIIAISQTPKNVIVVNNAGFITDHGLLVTHKGQTTREGVFASGDVVTGSKTVVQAVADAKNVADEIDEYCKSLRGKQ
ncbi:NAD(P)-dependent oxidoreductase [Tissierella sp. Yu-01]|uniref:NAD(P)-dependent oxidoreductase n=1 Tax=Tissierella sp. Yu-01 TaxID=3035694 RepID=UPI00240E21E0|nr:NAD(P)-dependent oxidoreductase [Tissierella sp. Yu-01]WFA09317.1 NAD(P)-dependent oxidoreductase [Tissierella sp. Yu-01]